MIVVLGAPCSESDVDGVVVAGGRAVAIARAAVAAGAVVEVAGRIGDDADGDAAVLDLGRRGIGHAALLRVGGLATPDVDEGAGTALAAADVELALRYLPSYGVVVVTEDVDRGGIGAAAEVAAWAGAHLVVVGEGDEPIVGLPDASTVLVAPRPADGEEQGGAFASFVGAYAAAIDRGVDPGRAFADQAAIFNPERID